MARILLLLLVLVAFGLSGCSNGGDGDAAPPGLPRYTGGTCPAFSIGENSLPSGGEMRRFLLLVNGEAQGAPVVFAWHWLAGGPYELVFATGLVNLTDVIVVAPFATGDKTFTWDSAAPPGGNADLRLFDDLLACLDAQYAVDRDRVWTTGMSAGALWSAYLLQYRSEFLAAAALLSGGEPDPGIAPPYRSPDRDLPVLLAWGGDSDVFRMAGQSFVHNNGDPEVFSFAVASQVLSGKLRADGHFVVHCAGDYGHTVPLDAFDVIWPFLRDHPRGTPQEPWANGVPDDASPLCALP